MPTKPRQIIRPIGPSIAYVPLTRGFYALIDSEDADRIGRYCWMACRSHGTFYAGRTPRAGSNIVFMHRLILGIEDSMLCDHRNRNRLDNRKCNLREATPVQNGQNRGPNSNSKTGERGIRLRIDQGKYTVRTHVNGKRKFIGQFATLSEAVEARDAEMRREFGEFAPAA